MSEQMGIFDVIYHCRSMRRLKPDPVPEELLLRICEAGNQAPTGSNMQGVRWIIVRDPEQRTRLAELNRKSVLNYVDTRRVDVPHHDPAKRQRMLDAVLWQAEHMGEVPALILACHQWLEAPADDAARAGAGGSVWPAVQNALLAARALGLGATATTLGLVDKPAVREVLGVPDTVEPYVLIPVGYPMGNFGPVTRLPVEETVRYDRWEQ
ncbi:MAG: nitroreductase family protein [Chloroflexi bacterium]|nr:nitroreductase family protein [Chloroflexota bacterium]